MTGRRAIVIISGYAARMMDLVWSSATVIAAAGALALLAIHLVGLALMARACAPRPSPPLAAAPPISVARILCGLEPHSRETLESTFLYDYPVYEALFCVARADDPVIDLARAAMARHPHVPARLLVGEIVVGANPKLNNMGLAWREAAHQRVVFVDSNLLTPPCYLKRLAAVWADDVGVVSSAPVGARPQSAAAELEVAFLNTHAARWQFAAAACGRGFAQGKTLGLRKGALPLGDLRPLAAEPAEDAALTRLAEACGKRVALVAPPFAQPLGRRSFAAVWARQTRWARLRRASFPGLYACEALAGGAPAIALAAMAATLAGAPAAAAIFAGVWYGAEWAAARRCRWPSGARAVLAMAARDLLLPAVWLAGLAGGEVRWRGATVALSIAPRGVARRFAGAAPWAARLRRLARRQV
ncbi:MAG: glycosyltransferase [Methylobacteriaceae bacterium]|nr:glycosyltransferase [Methylobacteriaceae bacterium]